MRSFAFSFGCDYNGFDAVLGRAVTTSTRRGGSVRAGFMNAMFPPSPPSGLSGRYS